MNCSAVDNHPGAPGAQPLLEQEGSSAGLPSSDEEGRRARAGGGAEKGAKA
jgi:hypothetical protein